MSVSAHSATPRSPLDAPSAVWPITFDEVLAARDRLAPHLTPTPSRRYALLERELELTHPLVVKHENFQPTGSFKVRNGLALVSGLDDAARTRGVVGASTGNHGQGVAYAGALLGTAVTICVPAGNNPGKVAAMRAFGARVIEEGRDYDESVQVMQRIARDEGLTIAHSTNDPRVIAGAATMTLEILADEPELDALIVAVGGGSQAVGAITVARALRPSLEVYGVQAAGASAQHDSWHAREPRTTERATTFAEGVATRRTYELTFPALRDGLAGFVTVTDAEIAAAMRTIITTTHTLVEGAGAMGVAALPTLRERLAGKRVAVVLCGANESAAVLRRVLGGEL
ncbi:MAG TPA: threonine/serine dehydratase [Gemmatimonadaceae bacterium]|nr:threonine/serine dehydratase [Gemmatimonadaceae bacterium]